MPSVLSVINHTHENKSQSQSKAGSGFRLWNNKARKAEKMIERERERKMRVKTIANWECFDLDLKLLSMIRFWLDFEIEILKSRTLRAVFSLIVVTNEMRLLRAFVRQRQVIAFEEPPGIVIRPVWSECDSSAFNFLWKDTRVQLQDDLININHNKGPLANWLLTLFTSSARGAPKAESLEPAHIFDWCSLDCCVPLFFGPDGSFCSCFLMDAMQQLLLANNQAGWSGIWPVMHYLDEHSSSYFRALSTCPAKWL